MILTDAYELKLRLADCKTVQETAKVLDEFGEDCDENTAKQVFEGINSQNGFELDDGGAKLRSERIFCPKCKNISPDKLLSSVSELLSGADNIHFGCCECGEQFTI